MRFIAFIWKTLAGAVLCLTPVTAILVVGWLARHMQRSSFKVWLRESGPAFGSADFSEFVSSDDETAYLANWPNWFLGHRAGGAGNSGALGRMFGSLWSNLKLGFQVLFNTWVLTLPGCLIWALVWWGGWENSFNKGYEQAAVAPVVGLAGIAVFLFAMLHVPLAQARQAATGNWRAFYDFGFVRQLRRSSRWLTVWLAILFAIAGLVMAGLHAGPLAIGNLLDGAADMTTEKMERIAVAYHVLAGSVIFVLVVILRTTAARVYARALLRGVRAGDITADMLADNEKAFFARLGLLEQCQIKDRGLVGRAVVSTGRGFAGIITLLVLLLIWFVFVAQLFVAQFLNHNWISWMNLPLVQVPWLYGP